MQEAIEAHQAEPATRPDHRIFFPQVKALHGHGEVWTYAAIKRPAADNPFPRPDKLGNKNCWWESDVRSWIEREVARSMAAEAAADRNRARREAGHRVGSRGRVR